MKFTESKLEHAFAELLAQEGYPHCLDNALSRQPDEALIEDDPLSVLNYSQDKQLIQR
jgi:type I restriction enzyme R subunit